MSDHSDPKSQTLALAELISTTISTPSKSVSSKICGKNFLLSHFLSLSLSLFLSLSLIFVCIYLQPRRTGAIIAQYHPQNSNIGEISYQHKGLCVYFTCATSFFKFLHKNLYIFLWYHMEITLYMKKYCFKENEVA